MCALPVKLDLIVHLSMGCNHVVIIIAFVFKLVFIHSEHYLEIAWHKNNFLVDQREGVLYRLQLSAIIIIIILQAENFY